ncbi:MAG: hypothetical protein V4773_04215, partial [Verrucomicrobiota bacterium]
MKHLKYFILLFVSLACLQAQDNWTDIPQSPTTANLWSIAYGDRTLVVAGEEGTILSYNYDDKVWIPRESGVRDWLVGAAYGNGRFVIVGDNGIIFTSDDNGATWTRRVSGTTIRLNSAVYGNGRWLVVGEQGVVLTSVDGTTWETRPSLGTGFLRALAFGQGRWLIGGARGAFYTTTDATTFTPVPFSTTSDIEGVAISAGRFWIVGSGGLRATATALDGWQVRTDSITATFRGVTVRNLEEASAVGERVADTYGLRSATGLWINVFRAPTFLATAVVQGLNEVVSVGFGGRIARSSMDSQPFILSDADRYVPYGSDVRISLISGVPPISYQWLRNGVALPDETRSELVIRNMTPANSSGYGIRYSTAQGTSTLSSLSFEVIAGGLPELRDPTFATSLPDLPSVVAPQPDGKILIAGPFQVSPTGGPSYGLARLNSDGSLDPGFRAGEGIPTISSIGGIHLMPDGRIYVRGTFKSIVGQPRSGLARLLANGALDPSFNPTQPLSPSRAVVAPDGRLFVDDSLSTRYGNVTRLALDGSPDPTFPVLENHRLVAVDTGGRLLAARRVNDNRIDLLRYLPDGTLDPSYAPTVIDAQFYMDYFSSAQLVGDALYATHTDTYRKFGAVSYYTRYFPGGGVDPLYVSPPPSPYPATGVYWAFWLPDGTLLTYIGGQVIAYNPNGVPDATRFATLPNRAEYRPLASTATGVLYAIARPRLGSPTLVRITPLIGRRGRLTNLSVRAFASAEAPLISGFVTSGNAPTTALVRAIGPSLAQFGVTDPLANPLLTLTRNGATLASSDNWDSALAPRFTAVGAFPLPEGSQDAALESPIALGDHTAMATPATGNSGIALVELYESADATTTPAPRRFINVSARGPVASERPLIAGFGLTGTTPIQLIVRGAGPALAAFGVTDALSNPRLTLYRGATVLWENDTAAGDANAASVRVGAFPFPNGSRDSAMLVTLPPGTYTA